MSHYSALSLAGALLIFVGPIPAALWLARPSTVPRPLAAIVWWCVLQSVLGTLLGVVHLFRPWAILACEAVLLVATGVRFWPARAEQTERPRLPGWPSLLVLLAPAVLALVLLARCLAVPVTETDSLAYHLPYAVTWIQQGWLAPISGLLRYPMGYYPGGWEVISALLMSPVRDDLLATVPSLLAWAVLLLAIVSLGSVGGSDAPPAKTAARAGKGVRRPFVPRWTPAVACAALVANFPITLQAVATARCDLPVAAMFLTAVLAGLTYRKARSPYDLALMLVALGILPAMKPTGFVYAGLAATVLFPWRGVVSLRHWVVVTSLVVALFLSCVWYIRNLALSGNPLGVVQIALGGHVLFPGWVTSERLSRGSLVRAFHLGSSAHWRALAVYGWAWLGAGFPVVLVLARPTAGLSRESRYRALLALAAVSFVLYLVTPYSAAVIAPYRIARPIGHQMRFALPFFGLLGALASLGLARLRPAAVYVAAVAAAGLIITSLFAQAVPLTAAALLLIWALAGAAIVVWQRRRWARLAALVIGLACLIPVLLVVGQQRSRARLEAYGPSYRYLSTLPSATRVGYLPEEAAMSSFAYRLYGERMDLRPIYVPCDERGSAAWRSSLRAQGIRAVAIGPYAGRVSSEASACLAQLDEPESGFARVAGQSPVGDIVLYQVN